MTKKRTVKPQPTEADPAKKGVERPYNPLYYPDLEEKARQSISQTVDPGEPYVRKSRKE